MYMMLNGLHHIHSNRVVHRDLKPENCLIDQDFRLKIIDFGLSKRTSKREHGNVMMGTPDYLAPEIYAKNGAVDVYKPPVDCWAAGIIMF